MKDSLPDWPKAMDPALNVEHSMVVVDRQTPALTRTTPPEMSRNVSLSGCDSEPQQASNSHDQVKLNFVCGFVPDCGPLGSLSVSRFFLSYFFIDFM